MESFESGWIGITAGLRRGEIDQLIDLLADLRDGRLDHFHTHALFDADSPAMVADIEISLADDDEDDNMRLG